MSMVFCRGCGKEIHETAVSCPHCGAPQSKASSGSGKKQDTAFLLACFLGVLGGHRFYLGNIGLGILYLFTLGLLGIGALIDLFNLVSMRPEVFAEKYNNGVVGQPIGTWTKGLLIFPVVIALVIYGPFFQSFYQGVYKGYSQRQAEVELAATTPAQIRQAEVTAIQTDKFSELAAATPAQISPTGELADMFNLMSDNTDLQRENKFKEIKGKVVEWTLPVYEVKKDGSGYMVQTEADDIVGAFVYITARNDQDKAIIEGFKTGSRISFKGVINDVTLRHLEIKPAILFQAGSAKSTAIEAQHPSGVVSSIGYESVSVDKIKNFSGLNLSKFYDPDVPKQKYSYKASGMVEIENFIGTCGNSGVKIQGVDNTYDNNFSMDNGEIVVRSGPTKQLNLRDALSDHNGIACVVTKYGSRLLIWSNCGGSSCGDSPNFYVIDPEKLAYLAPKEGEKGLCDAQCASRVLGNNLPQDINN